MLSQLRPAIASFVALSLVTGVAYPLAVTAIAKVTFPRQADGSLIVRHGEPVGSSLIGQNFTDPKYFWPRPSNAGTNGYDATSGSGSNLATSNPALRDAIAGRINALHAAGHDVTKAIPVDLVTASASGLDPHLSLEAAEFQVARVAAARGLSEATVRGFVEKHTTARTMGLLGEPVVNVVELNLSLDAAER